MNLPARELQELQRLFDQQMWAFGRDVIKPGDNLLARRGFQRTPAPLSAQATSSVWKLTERDLELELSSVGVRLTTAGRCLFLDRDPTPNVLLQADPAPLARLLEWFSHYERWVEAQSSTWRAESLAQRSRRPAFAAETMAPRWSTFADEVRR